MTLPTVEEHNSERLKAAVPVNKWAAPVNCNKCKTQMQFVDDMVLMSNPPKRRVKCIACDTVDYMVVC